MKQRIGFWPPDAPDEGDDEPYPQAVGTGSASFVADPPGDEDEEYSEWVWEFHDRNVVLAVKLGPFVFVLGKHG